VPNNRLMSFFSLFFANHHIFFMLRKYVAASHSIFYSILFVAFLASFAGCKKSSPHPVGFTPGMTVYMAGSDDSGNVVYWTNGLKMTLAQSGSATGIVVSGTDIYVSGYLNRGSEILAAYWKNGVQYNLTESGIAHAWQIVLNGNDVYIPGDVFGTAPQVSAVYWKNGNLVNLTPYPFGTAKGLAFAGPDMYVIGQIWSPAGFDTACVWENDTLKTNFFAINGPLFNAVAANGSDIYVVTSEGTYSKDFDIGVTLPGATSAGPITFSGQDVYVVGTTAGATGTSSLAYWKNGAVTTLASGYKLAEANATALAGTDLYVAGYVSSGGGAPDLPVYWKNGVMGLLNMQGGQVNAIAVGN
jgi:hypothetical protein